MSDIPQLGFRVVQTTIQEPIPKAEKTDFPWLALAILVFGLILGSQKTPNNKNYTTPQPAALVVPH
jgi:hypothetical protein